MDTHNVCLYKEVNKKYAGCNLKTTELLDCALIGVCAVIRSNTVLIISALQTMGDRYNCRSTLIGVCFVFFFILLCLEGSCFEELYLCPNPNSKMEQSTSETKEGMASN